MKQLLLLTISLSLLAVASVTLAAPKPKSTILHCGCTWDDVEAAMQYTESTVSARSKGHDAHVAGSIDSCFAGLVDIGEGLFEAVYVDFVRGGDDCQLAGPPLGEPIADCPELDGPVAGDVCGMEVLTP